MFTDNQVLQILTEWTPEVRENIRKHVAHTGPIKVSECLPPFYQNVVFHLKTKVTEGYMANVDSNGAKFRNGDFFLSKDEVTRWEPLPELFEEPSTTTEGATE